MEAYQHLTDQELLQRYDSSGQTEWLGMLLKRYTLLLFGVGMKYLKNEEEAKDIVQAVFLKALIELPKYKVVYVKSWLYMIARNQCFMKLRQKNNTFSMEEYTSEIADTTDSYPNILHQDALIGSIEVALNQLNIEQKTCISLFYLQKLSYQQISDKTGYSLLQIKSHIQNGKRNLKIKLQKQIDHD